MKYSFENDTTAKRLCVKTDVDGGRITIGTEGRYRNMEKALITIDAIEVETIRYWTEIIAEKDKYIITPDGNVYRDIAAQGGPFHGDGFGGQMFGYLTNDGVRHLTANLWYRGRIPEPFRELLPTNCSSVELVEWKLPREMKQLIDCSIEDGTIDEKVEAGLIDWSGSVSGEDITNRAGDLHEEEENEVVE